MSLDVLRMFGKRNQLRRAARVVASIPAEVNDNPVAVFDVTALGAGFETNQELTPKQQLLLRRDDHDVARLRERDAADHRAQRAQGLAVTANPEAMPRWRVGVEFAERARRRPSIRSSSTA